ncbi:MAG: XRE family transcriptional regulator, partial [Oxalobacteraceae bacterium]|nr:XRE family transcriptional regulator [Oxalobacteraceae bacterium]
MNRFRHEPQLQTTVLGKMIERVRREHHLSTVTLAMLAGLSDTQIRAIEEGASHTFVDEAHRIDCARRIAIAMGLPETYFLQTDNLPAEQRATPIEAAPVDGIGRAMWGHLPVAELKVLASLRTTEQLPELQQRRSSSPMLIALILALLLS